MDLIDLGATGTRPEDFDTFLDKIRDRYGFDHAAYAGSNPIAGTIHAYVTYPEEWKQYYLEQRLHLFDPTLSVAARSISPVHWGRLERTPNFDRVFGVSAEFGIFPQGLTIPVRGPYGDIGMLSVTRNCVPSEWDLLIPMIISDLQSIAVHLHDGAMRSHTLTRSLRAPNLSNREVEILQWIAAGKSQQDVGDILGISHRTVEVHLRSGRDKLYALTTVQAVARAIAMGLIYPL
jgi:DNA-binding CsgD family transcriptional regulator